MGYEKSEIIRDVLNEQAGEAEKLVGIAIQETHEHEGAAKALILLGKQMPSFMASIEKRIEDDPDLGAAADPVRVYVKNVIARFHTMCIDNAQHQRNCKLQAQGQVPMLKKMAENYRKKGDLAVATAKQREETDKANRAKKDAEDAEKAADKKAKEAKKKKAAKKTPTKKPDRRAKIEQAAYDF